MREAGTVSASVRKDYVGTLMYENGTLDRIRLDGDAGFVTFSGSTPQYYYFIKDYQGNNRVLASESGTAEQVYSYYPFGTLHQTQPTVSNDFLYSGKEYNSTTGMYDFLNRFQSPSTARFTVMDPMAEKYYGISPYAYCGNDPVNYVDPDGRDWYLLNSNNDSRIQIYYTTLNSQQALEDAKINGEYLGEAVVIYFGSYSERLGEGDNLYGKGANLANVVVYGPENEKDIKEYSGYTMSSNPEAYGVVKDGQYDVVYDEIGKSGALKSNFRVMYNGQGKLPVLNDFNPAFPERNPAYIEGVFIHRSNLNGFAGERNGDAISKGCLLIAPKEWNAFCEQLDGLEFFKLILQRQ